MFTWNPTQRMFALVKDDSGGKWDGKILYYTDSKSDDYNYNTDEEDDYDTEDDIHEEVYEDNKGNIFSLDGELISTRVQRLKEKKNKKGGGKYIKKNKPKKVEAFDYVELPDKCHFLYIPDTHKDRETLYCAAPNGGGKSFFVSQYLKLYQEQKPDNKFILFSLKNSDAVLDKRNPTRVKFDETLLNDPVKIEEIQNTITVFDDIDSITDKKMSACVRGTMKMCLNVGRSLGITTIVTNHMLLNHSESKIMLNECSICVIFPGATSPLQLSNFLKNYIGSSPKAINKIKKLKSRWVMIFKDGKQRVLTENQAFSMNYIEEKMNKK